MILSWKLFSWAWEEMAGIYEIYSGPPCLNPLSLPDKLFCYVERKREYEERIKRVPPSHVRFTSPIWKMEQVYISHGALHLKTHRKNIFWYEIVSCMYSFIQKRQWLSANTWRSTINIHAIGMTPQRANALMEKDGQEDKWPQNNLILAIKKIWSISKCLNLFP